ncbi:hypothetical protein GOODEAATRI_025237, partial [Goodea atripinnis]
TGFIQARREEEQRSPFWGTRLAIPLPVVLARDTTLHLRPPSSLLVFGTCIQCCTLPLPGMGELHCSLPALPPAEDAAAVRTLFLLLCRLRQAPPHPSQRVWPTLLPLAWRLRLCFLVPSLAPAITQCPLVVPGGRTWQLTSTV